MNDSMEMPRYRSHKQVRALEISSITKKDGGTVLTFCEAGYAPKQIPSDCDLFARYKPVPGDFFVAYKDGYESFSPRAAFLEGYARV